MFVLFRTITYATVFVGVLLIYLPARILSSTGLARPSTMGAPEVVGMVIGIAGALLALWCVVTFVWIGKGTPAPFDPPQKLVVRGPYQFVRNPMYIGGVLALYGAALFFLSVPLLAYAAGFLLVAHLFVVFYEEPALRRSFGADYEGYCRRVSRWRAKVSFTH